jgi:hypothetical protein
MTKEEELRHRREVQKRNAELSAKTDRLDILKALQKLYDATNDWAHSEFARNKKRTAPESVEGALREARLRLDNAYGIIR